LCARYRGADFSAFKKIEVPPILEKTPVEEGLAGGAETAGLDQTAE
jgi:hypothetical protein